jgi:hypothetical protein
VEHDHDFGILARHKVDDAKWALPHLSQLAVPRLFDEMSTTRERVQGAGSLDDSA